MGQLHGKPPGICKMNGQGESGRSGMTAETVKIRTKWSTSNTTLSFFQAFIFRTDRLCGFRIFT